MDVRRATPADLEAVRRLWEEFEREVPEPVGEPERWEHVQAEAAAALEAGTIFLAEAEGAASGLAWGGVERGVGRLEVVYVRPAARRRGLAGRLVAGLAAELAARGATDVVLEVVASNDAALALWRRLGFRVVEHRLAVPLAELERRLG